MTSTTTVLPESTDQRTPRHSRLTAETPLAELENLNVWFLNDAGPARHVVRDLTLAVHPGECVAVIGESGSGKSVTARSLIGLTGQNSHIQADTARLGQYALNRVTGRQWRRIRGADVGFILQDALVSLDPLRTVGAEIGESLRLHGMTDAAQRRAKVVELLNAVGVPEPELRAQQRPGELSGGLRQRALIASAVANDPPLLIADEPTTALDVTVQAQVLDLLALRKAAGTALLLISHDFSVVGKLADRILVMQGGAIVESGTADQVLEDPRHEYTRQLLEAVPSGETKGEYLTLAARSRAMERAAGEKRPAGQWQSAETTSSQISRSGHPVLEAIGLTKAFRGPDGVHRTVVEDVSFQVQAGQTLGIVGESGSGKSTAAAMALGLLDPDAGTVQLNGQPWSSLSVAGRRRRRRDMTVVYQDPLSSFDPRWNAERILTDALRPDTAAGLGLRVLQRGVKPSRSALRQRAAELVELVGLDPKHLVKHPYQLSGGQRQRLAIARALAPQPDVVVLDEAVSALDVSVQAQVLDLLTELQQRLGTTYVFISHDLGVIHHMSHEILVMEAGSVVEYGEADEVFGAPQHPYTQALLDSLEALHVRPPQRSGAQYAEHMSEQRIISASGTVQAPAQTIFELIADPARQPEWDGNDNLRSAEAGQRVHAVGEVFTVVHTNGKVRPNEVVEFEEGRLIGWKPSPEGEPQPGHIWRWELEPLEDGATQVTHTYDWTGLDDPTRFEKARSTTEAMLTASIDRLRELAESR